MVKETKSTICILSIMYVGQEYQKIWAMDIWSLVLPLSFRVDLQVTRQWCSWDQLHMQRLGPAPLMEPILVALGSMPHTVPAPATLGPAGCVLATLGRTGSTNSRVCATDAGSSMHGGRLGRVSSMASSKESSVISSNGKKRETILSGLLKEAPCWTNLVTQDSVFFGH